MLVFVNMTAPSERRSSWRRPSSSECCMKKLVASGRVIGRKGLCDVALVGVAGEWGVAVTDVMEKYGESGDVTENWSHE